MRRDLSSKGRIGMGDPARNEPWSSDDLMWRGWSDEATRRGMAEMQRELGRRDSPAFDRLKSYLRAPFDISGVVVAHIVQMLRHRCFADSQSFRKMRGEALWAEMHWLTEEMLIEAFSVLSTSQGRRRGLSSALVQHQNAGPTLWEHVLSKRVDINTVLDIAAAANARHHTAFLLHLENSIGALDIVASNW